MNARDEEQYPFTHLRKYPTDPAELPEDRLQHAYGDTRPVPRRQNVRLSLQRFANGKSKFLRKSANGIARSELSSQLLPQGGINAALKAITDNAAVMLPRQMDGMLGGSFSSQQGHQCGQQGDHDSKLALGSGANAGANARNWRGVAPRVQSKPEKSLQDQIDELQKRHSSQSQQSPLQLEDEKDETVTKEVEEKVESAGRTLATTDGESDTIAPKQQETHDASPTSKLRELPHDPITQMRAAMAEGRAAAKPASIECTEVCKEARTTKWRAVACPS